MAKSQTVAEKENSVRKFVSQRFEANAMAESMEEFNQRTKVQVNVRIHPLHAFMLEHLSEALYMTRPELAEELLNSALHDAWDEAGLPEIFESDELKQKALAYIREKSPK